MLLPPLRATSLRTEAERRRLAPLVGELGALGIFGEASCAALERIARSAEATTVESGQVVFSEGDPPADLYVVRSGTVVVSTEADGEIRRLGPGDWFGEIGLLRRIGRTATITVAETAQLLAVPGTVFLDAVMTQERVPDPLAATLTTRLAGPILTWPKTRLTRAPDRLRQVSVDAQWGIVTMAVVEIPHPTLWS